MLTTQTRVGLEKFESIVHPFPGETLLSYRTPPEEHGSEEDEVLLASNIASALRNPGFDQEMVDRMNHDRFTREIPERIARGR